MIIEREDYITQEEYDKCYELYKRVNSIVIFFKNRTPKRDDSVNGSYLNNSSAYKIYVSKRNDDVHFYIYKDTLKNLGIYENVLEQCQMGCFCDERIYGHLKFIKNNYQHYSKSKEIVNKYKGKTIKLNKFDNKNKFKDIYETIKTVEEKYE